MESIFSPKEMETVLSHLCLVEELHFEFSPDSAEDLSRLLALFPKIKMLSILYAQKHANVVAEALENNKTVETLNILCVKTQWESSTYRSILDDKINQLVLSLVHLLEVNSYLKVLAVGKVGTDLAILLVMAAMRSPYLETLKLDDYYNLRELHFPLSDKIVHL